MWCMSNARNRKKSILDGEIYGYTEIPKIQEFTK